jgi:outer membrane receptor for ferrienterochelin and colicins
MKTIYTLFLVLIGLCHYSLAENPSAKKRTKITGSITSLQSQPAYVNIAVKGTTMGTLSDENGVFELGDVPEGNITLVARAIGYEQQEITINTQSQNPIVIQLTENALRVDEVVVSADRNEQRRTDASVIVSTIAPKLFENTHSVTLSEGLNFCPGLRLENNCQNCGFTQVRMNGMEGPYSQILINSRPIFSGLAGVYGLELIPSNMIERVEVVRGGGSALYGSNAIAGTINLILKDPVANTYELGFNTGLTGVGMSEANRAADYSVNFNTSIISDDRKTGLSLYGFTRERQMFDANDDGFSEISPMSNTTIGTRFFHRFGDRSKVAIDFFNINEERAGGDKHDYPFHERQIAEAVAHKLKSGAITYDRFFRENDLMTIYSSGQYLNRDSYYGANYSLSDYGNSKDLTYNLGAQYKANFTNSSLVAGLETTSSHLLDKKLGYADYENAIIENGKIIDVTHTDNITVSDQQLSTSGLFAQYEHAINKLKISAGARFDHYRVEDFAKNGQAKTGNVISPRITVKYDLLKELQLRGTYSQGYRAPQIFDEDLHIETSGSRQVINVNDPNLKQETSTSYMLSLDYNKKMGSTLVSFLTEGFYTQLHNPFVNEIGEPDADGVVIYTRINADAGAVVKGMNFELKLTPSPRVALTSGMTIQSSKYEEAQEFDEKRFFRTPNHYGFFTVDWEFAKKWSLNTSANYTGKMLVPYFGPTITDPEEGELRESSSFVDLGIKLQYDMKWNGVTLRWFGGVKNMLAAYQNDFDKGIERDPAYMYGPNQPRAIYLGVKLGNMLR